jgi:hypothetical protein
MLHPRRPHSAAQSPSPVNSVFQSPLESASLVPQPDLLYLPLQLFHVPPNSVFLVPQPEPLYPLLHLDSVSQSPPESVSPVPELHLLALLYLGSASHFVRRLLPFSDVWVVAATVTSCASKWLDKKK